MNVPEISSFLRYDMSDTLAFKAFCFEAYRAEHKLSGIEAMERFKKYDVLDYLNTCYAALHTTGRDFIVKDIDMFIEKRSFPPTQTTK